MNKKNSDSVLFQESSLADDDFVLKRGNSGYVHCYFSKSGTIICEPTDDPALNTPVEEVKKMMKLVE